MKPLKEIWNELIDFITGLRFLQGIADFLNSIFSNCYQFINSNAVFTKVKEFIIEKKIIVIVGISLSMLLIIIFSTMFSLKNAEKKVQPLSDLPVLPLVDSLVLPPEPSVSDDYSLYREPKKQWTDDETTRWFSMPNSAMLEQLNKTNNVIISNVLGEAP